MKTFKLTLTAGLLAWGLTLVLPNSASAAIRISIAMPVQTFDFSDLDLRDENNQPISAPQIRQRFEDALNQNLNRLLIQNLTPLRRAWLAIAQSTTDVFAEVLRQAAPAAFVTLATLSDRGAKWISRGATRAISAVAAHDRLRASRSAIFVSLASLLIASTRLIR